MSDVKFCAESNGATPEAEKWSKRKRTQKNIQKLLKISKNKKKKHIRLFKSSNIWGESYVKPCADSMVLLPALKIGFMKKYAQKTKFKMAHDELKPRKKHTHPNE